MWPRRHACKTKTHTRACVSVHDRCRMDCCILSCKGGPWGSRLSVSTPGISCDTNPLMSHTLLSETPPCLCECVWVVWWGFIMSNILQQMYSCQWYDIVLSTFMHLYNATCLPKRYPFFSLFKNESFFICNNWVRKSAGCCLVCKVSYCLVSACTNKGVAGVCCGLYCSCLASWGHAFLRVRIWLQPTCCHSCPLLSYICI